MSQTISIGDKITNSIKEIGGTFETITNVTFSTTNLIKTATITTANETIVKDVDFITLSSDDKNGGINVWVVGQ